MTEAQKQHQELMDAALAQIEHIKSTGPAAPGFLRRNTS